MIPLDDDTDFACRHFSVGINKTLIGLSDSQVLSWAIYRQFHDNPYSGTKKLALAHVIQQIEGWR